MFGNVILGKLYTLRSWTQGFTHTFGHLMRCFINHFISNRHMFQRFVYCDEFCDWSTGMLLCFQSEGLNLWQTSWGTFLPYPAGTPSTRRPLPSLWVHADTISPFLVFRQSVLSMNRTHTQHKGWKQLLRKQFHHFLMEDLRTEEWALCVSSQIYMYAAWHGWAIPMFLFLALLRLSLNYLIARSVVA